MRQLHIPAVLPSPQWQDPTKSWFAELPHVLVSYAHWRRQTVLPVDRYTAGAYVIGDSGGYSIATQGADIDPVGAMHWQIGHCNVGFILDVPPYGSTGSDALTNTKAMQGRAADRWAESLDKTVKHVRRALPEYLRSRQHEDIPFRWWGVLHGETPEQRTAWWNAVRNIYTFPDPDEGWAIKIHPLNDALQLAHALRFLGQQKVRQVHVLGGVGLQCLSTLFVLGQQIGLNLATYDSSSSIKRGLRRAVMIPTPDGLDFEERLENWRDRKEVFGRAYMRDKCDCDSCQDYRRDHPVEGWGSEREVEQRMVYHNHLTLLSILDRRWSLAKQDPDGYLRAFVPQWAQVLKAFDGIPGKSIATGTPRSLFDYL
jgi:hypothetical protein